MKILKGEDHVGDTGVDSRIILKPISKKDVKM
jgi:hypothetical protein